MALTKTAGWSTNRLTKYVRSFAKILLPGNRVGQGFTEQVGLDRLIETGEEEE